MKRFFVAVIEKGKGGFGVFFPDLPGLASWGDTVAHASENAFAAAQSHIALGLEHGDTIPEPRSPDKIEHEPGVKEVARLLVPVEIADEKVRVNISLSSSVLAALDARASAMGIDRSAAIARLVTQD